MQKKRSRVSSKKVNKKIIRPIPKLDSSRDYSWVWYLIGALVILGALYFIYDGLTGNVITGNATAGEFWGDYLQPALEYLVGYDMTGSNTGQFQDYFSMTLLIMLVVFCIIFVSLKAIPFFNDDDHSWVLWVASIAVTLLSVRFLTQEWIVTILLPYSTLGIAISAGLPFVVFFFVVSNFKSPTMRRIAWIFFAIIFLYLFFARSSAASNFGLSNGPYYGIYLWTAGLAGLMVMFDGTFTKIRNKINFEKTLSSHNNLKYVHLMERRDKIEARLLNETVGTPIYTNLKSEIQNIDRQLIAMGFR